MKKNDILSRADIEFLVNSFYDKVKEDEILGYLFTDSQNKLAVSFA